MASIQKRPGRRGARYRVQVRLQGQAISSTFTTKAAARKWATQVESGIQRTHHTSTVVQVTLGELLQRYRREVLPHKRRGTQANQGYVRYSCLCPAWDNGQLWTDPNSGISPLARLSGAGPLALRHCS